MTSKGARKGSTEHDLGLDFDRSSITEPGCQGLVSVLVVRMVDNELFAVWTDL